MNSEVGPVVVPNERDSAAAQMRPPARRGLGLRPGGKSEKRKIIIINCPVFAF
jgi:hypothetical protein